MITCCPYSGPRQAKTSIAKIQHITRPDTFAQKDKYILHFNDKQCQNESVVGGKGYSLAILTSIMTDDVCTWGVHCCPSRNINYIRKIHFRDSFVVYGTSRILCNVSRFGTTIATSQTIAELDHRYNRY